MDYLLTPTSEWNGPRRTVRCRHGQVMTLTACMDWQYGEADCLFALFVSEDGCRYVEDSCNDDSTYQWARVTQEEADFFASLPNLHTHRTVRRADGRLVTEAVAA